MTSITPENTRRIESAQMVGIVKRFPGVLANNHVDFDVRAGEIHALLGENGAGKSTLVRQLYGLYRPDEGKILINGQERSFLSPLDAIEAGIGMIHQHFMLVPSLTVVENVALGLKSSNGFVLDLDQVEQRLMGLCETVRDEDQPARLPSGSFRSASSSGWRLSKPSTAARIC